MVDIEQEIRCEICGEQTLSATSIQCEDCGAVLCPDCQVTVGTLFLCPDCAPAETAEKEG